MPVFAVSTVRRERGQVSKCGCPSCFKVASRPAVYVRVDKHQASLWYPLVGFQETLVTAIFRNGKAFFGCFFFFLKTVSS